MAGHSKWANIKHRKSKQDAQKGKVFTKLAREIIVATKQGGGDPEGNFRLRIAIDKAKSANMPNDNINRAIQKGLGSSEGDNFEEIIYEGYGPGGVAIMLEIMTDNRNRTAGNIRHIFDKNDGNMGETGCVSWMFDRKGYFSIDRDNLRVNEEEFFLIGLEAGAEDIKFLDDIVEIYSFPDEFEEVKNNLEEKKIILQENEITMVPQNTVEITDIEQAKKLLKLVEALEDHDDVQNVYSNFEIDETITNKL